MSTERLLERLGYPPSIFLPSIFPDMLKSNNSEIKKSAEETKTRILEFIKRKKIKILNKE